MTEQISSCLSMPEWFLESIDADNQAFTFIETSESRISELTFLDGRTPVSLSGRRVTIPVDVALDWLDMRSGARTPSMIFHTSFCGSTLLANLLQETTNALVYREPDILVQLANLMAKKHSITLDQRRWSAIQRLVMDQLSKSWADAPVVVKPSNWANTLLTADLMTPLTPAIVISSDDEEYLLANLRGGKARLNYSLQLLNHFLACGLVNRDDVQAVENGGHTPIGRLLRLLSILFDHQRALLDDSLGKAMRLSLSWLRSDPATAIENVKRLFGLSVDNAQAIKAIRHSQRHHAKAPEQSFRQEDELAENRRLYLEFEAEFQSLDDWRETLGRQKTA